MDEPDPQQSEALARQARVRHIVFGAMLIAGGVVLFFHQRNIFMCSDCGRSCWSASA